MSNCHSPRKSKVTARFYFRVVFFLNRRFLKKIINLQISNGVCWKAEQLTPYGVCRFNSFCAILIKKIEFQKQIMQLPYSSRGCTHYTVTLPELLSIFKQQVYQHFCSLQYKKMRPFRIAKGLLEPKDWRYIVHSNTHCHKKNTTKILKLQLDYKVCPCFKNYMHI